MKVKQRERRGNQLKGRGKRERKKRKGRRGKEERSGGKGEYNLEKTQNCEMSNMCLVQSSTCLIYS